MNLINKSLYIFELTIKKRIPMVHLKMFFKIPYLKIREIKEIIAKKLLGDFWDKFSSFLSQKLKFYKNL